MAFHSGDVMSELEAVKLSGAEKEALLGVMQRAKEFDQHYSSPGAALEGQLYKWTNPLKGWQQRWFTVDRQQGVLHYYMSEDRKKQAPRGSLNLWGAAIAPSEEDGQSFSISDTAGEVYKLKAGDAKERQWWVSRLHREVELRTSQTFGASLQETVKIQTSGPLPPSPVRSRDPTLTTPTGQTTPTHSASRSLSKRLQSLSLKPKHRSHKSASPTPSNEEHQKSHDGSHDQSRDLETELPGGDAMLEVLMRLQCYQECLVAHLQVNSKQAGFNPCDKNALLLRATSQAAVQSVKDGLALLKLQQQQQQQQQDQHTPIATSPPGQELSSLEGVGGLGASLGDAQHKPPSRSGSSSSRKSAPGS